MKLRWNELVKTREYSALVEGNVEVKSDTITSYLLKNQNDLMYSSKDPSGEYAITNYKVVKQNASYSLLRVNIETGRKNQIRVHMQDIGHPIVGDDKYGHTKNPLKRLGLHASKLEFVHPITKETIEISASVPNIFSGVFK
jgi:23S rRNA pseudouridine1911/1915/1917 synthase